VAAKEIAVKKYACLSGFYPHPQDVGCEPKIATLVNVHEHGRTLALVAVGYNRIGKEVCCAVERG
jgi:hypothetical protein